MIDREKIIKALECCKPNAFNGMNCEECPYKPSSLAEKRDGSCVRLVHDEVIYLLKEQDNCENCAIAIEDRQPVVRCKDCKYGALMSDTITYMCESPEQESRICVHEHDGYWFCADGERKVK